MRFKFIDYINLYALYPGKQGAFLRHQIDHFWPLLRTCARFYRRIIIPKTKIVAVIGSLGKTTTKRALEKVLIDTPVKQSFSNYDSALALNLMRIPLGRQVGVLEAGIGGPGRMESYWYMIKPQVVVVTSIASDHKRSFDSLADTRREKVDMVRFLSQGDTAVLNGDDEHVLWMKGQTKAKVVTYGIKENNDIRALDIENNWPEGTAFTVSMHAVKKRVQTKLAGKHMVYPALASIAVASVLKLDVEMAIKRLEEFTPTLQRMEILTLKNGVRIIDDSYKGSLETYDSALAYFKNIPAQRKLIVLGNVHEPPQEKGDMYRDLGAKIAGMADKIVFVGDQNYKRIRTGAMRAGMNPDDIIRVGFYVDEAIDVIKSMMRKGDVILVKGTGTQKLRRVTLALKGMDVSCNVKYCIAKVASCDECPLLNKGPDAFKNHYIQKYVKE